jgi:hypothetical protein
VADSTVAPSPVFFPPFAIRRKRKSTAERRHITEVRIQLYERSEGSCEVRESPKCWNWISWETMHAAHQVSAARGGKFELSNLRASCPECHIGWEHNGGKPCPSKRGVPCPSSSSSL